MDSLALTIEYRAFQELRAELARLIEDMSDELVSQSTLAREFGITATVLKRLRVARKVRPVRTSRRRNARVRYRLREVLLAVVRDGLYGTGRVRTRA